MDLGPWFSEAGSSGMGEQGQSSLFCEDHGETPQQLKEHLSAVSVIAKHTY